MDRPWNDDAATARSAHANRRTVLSGIGAGATAALLARLGPVAGVGAAQEAAPEARRGEFLVIRRYRLAPGATVAEVLRRTEEEFLPIIQQVPGFVEYLNVDLGDGQGATISVFSSQASADESTERAAAWVKENLAGLIEGPPEVMAGPILLGVTAPETPGARPA